MVSRILKVSWKNKVTNKKVLRRILTELHFMKDIIKRKMKYAGHVLRDSSGLSHLQIPEGWEKVKNKCLVHEEHA